MHQLCGGKARGGFDGGMRGGYGGGGYGAAGGGVNIGLNMVRGTRRK